MPEITPIGYIHTDFPEKFGIPRQSGRSEALLGRISLLPKYRQPEAFRGMEEFSHLWLVWGFSANEGHTYSATVKPPRLGGNERRGVFATRSPFRPNGLGLSCVKLEKLEFDPETGPVLTVSGIDMMDGTPIYDIKPYIAYTDAHPEASEGFAGEHKEEKLEVVFPEQLLKVIPEDKRDAALFVLSEDPRPAYQEDETRRYGVSFAGFDIRFHVRGNTLEVCEVEELLTKRKYQA